MIDTRAGPATGRRWRHGACITFAYQPRDSRCAACAARMVVMNHLNGSSSPYLQQHVDNPVDWWPWCDEAFAEARRRDVPILLSVGYASCRWCHER
jgi:hypothetical protein